MKFYIVDCFAETKYQGNQLAVFLVDQPLSGGEMQQIAQEMHFSETSFLFPARQENGGYRVRIFTPDVEVPFAGHPTLGTAYVIWKLLEGGASETVTLNLDVGPVPVSIQGGELTMIQNQPAFGETVERGLLAGILSLPETAIRDDFPIQWVSTGLPAYIIPLADLAALRSCQINHGLFRDFFRAHDKCNLLVFVPEREGLLSVRVFMDDTGFPEDPATGSANGNLAAYLLRHNWFGTDTLAYTVHQGEQAGRPSVLRVHGTLRDGIYTLQVGGRACLTAEGTWL